MASVRHPARPEIVIDVEDPTDWLAAGWLPIGDAKADPAPRETPARVRARRK